MNKKYKPDNLPGLIPYFVVKDIKKSITLYKDAFGFEVIQTMPDEKGNIQHAEMKKDDMVVMFCPEGAMGMTTTVPASHGAEEAICLYCYCEDVDALYKNAVSSGMKSVIEPQDMFWGDRMCALVDPDGYRWSFATFLGS